jgi:hypothetical protein
VKIIAVLAAVFGLLALPTDVPNFWAALTDPNSGADWRLALGLTLKTTMTALAVVGLWLDKTFGYCFLLGSSAQIAFIRVNEFLAVDFREYPTQFVLPGLDLAFRAVCFVWLATRWKRLIGEGVTP